MHKICSNFYTIGFSCPKIGEFYTTVSDKSHLSLPTCTKFASHFSCPTSIAPTPPPPAGSAAESPQVSTRKFLALQLGQTTACWGLQEKLWGRPWLKMMILPLKFALGGEISFFWESNLQILCVFIRLFITALFLFESPKTSCIACPHTLQIQITFYPSIMI